MSESPVHKQGEDGTSAKSSAVGPSDNKDSTPERSIPSGGAISESKPELDEFGLPIRPKKPKPSPPDSDEEDAFEDAPEAPGPDEAGKGPETSLDKIAESAAVQPQDSEDKGKNKDMAEPAAQPMKEPETTDEGKNSTAQPMKQPEAKDEIKKNTAQCSSDVPETRPDGPHKRNLSESIQIEVDAARARNNSIAKSTHSKSNSGQFASEWSYQQMVTQNQKPVKEEEEEMDWAEMPAYAPFDIYDDDNKLIAREKEDLDEDDDPYTGLGGAGRGYTRVQLDEDAQSATSMDDNTAYLFKDQGKGTALMDEDEDVRDAMSQLQATKELLTEGQKIAYVSLVRLAMVDMIKEVASLERTRNSKKAVDKAHDSITKWSQKIKVHLYTHMEITAEEQLMIEQLAEHGVQPGDLSPTLMLNARVKNPVGENVSSSARNSVALSRPASSTTLAIEDQRTPSLDKLALENDPPTVGTGAASSGRNSTALPRPASPSKEVMEVQRTPSPDKLAPENTPRPSVGSDRPPSYDPPPSYDEHGETLEEAVRTPSQLPQTKVIDIDIRWTVLCDLFLVLISDSSYDARSRQLLEIVASYLDVPWQDICRFEKRVTDALEMQEQTDKENWNEEDHMSNREKLARKRRYVMMGLATVGGGLVIGLSAGLLAPVIGAGLAAGFTTIGVAGTSGFLAGAGGAAIVTTTGIVTGGSIGLRASDKRTGAVETFEYRPLHNNKRVNLIVTVSGWMTGKVDDVRLPFSTVDPIMGDIYSVLWEPKMLQSMGDTINILATEALTQGLQQVLGATILVALMSAIQLPIILTKLSYLIDNPWTNSLARADAAGLIFADSLIDRNLGARPITLVGFSLGSRLIFTALKELAKKGAFGLVQNVYLFGSPVVAKKDEYIKARSVVTGRFVNGYVAGDWILGYLFRATGGGIARVAGLAPVEIPGIENIDAGPFVNGHMAYRQAMPRLLREVGWSVESDEFTEIEDPDPENHSKRQRELINEIEEARKELEKKPEKKRFGLFKSKKMAEKKEWEVYDEKTKPGGEESNSGILFDVDAIRKEAAELAVQGMQVKQLESTLPPMQLDIADITPRELESTLPPMKLDLHPPLDRTQSTPAVLPQDSKKMPADDGPEKSGAAPPLARSVTLDPASSNAGAGSASQDHSPSNLQANGSPNSRTLQPPVPIDLGHNVWDNDEFGGEREVKMTFE
ncbi:DUF726-domain-containing protein [Eremomyces bilateralis CBS 781.70]|uniref:DUF726-domain-containing protein n=1 Tax=Eremomyces bilateralis CBS 781.70 TaxID=1392243 RepID=A0A6G1FVG5_9PEZI|nr:DUF726-domain-containing protein [Eremomyces bilateralis CBS 781.70]KAF1809672.1 DUF726-domain-containing protein [Eremomyces bilateralis CBS 781.70]